MTDFLEVKPVRTFALGKELKTKKSTAFAVEAGEARLLEAQGLVEIVGEVKAEAPVDEVERVEDTSETETDAPAGRKPRKAKANADD